MSIETHGVHMYVTLSCAWLSRLLRLCFAVFAFSIAIMQCDGSCIAKPTIPQLHVDSATSVRPKYRQELLSLLARSSDPLSANELRDFKRAIIKNGWPTVKSVGIGGVNAAAILVLRATTDYSFQEAAENIVWSSRIYVDVNASAAAHWIDDIEYRHDRKQVFGTLLLLRDKKVVEPASLDKGNADFMRDFNGLPLLTNYIAQVQRRVDRGESLSEANVFPDFAKRTTHYSNSMLRQELDDMVANDQAARSACAKHQAQTDSAACRKVALIDSKNLPKEKSIFQKFGFPTSDMVGRNGVSSFFLLVQHAVADPIFQSSVLSAAAPLLASGDLAHQDYALLDDRVRLARGEKQLYGTQINLDKDGNVRLLPIYSPAGLDERRREMAMGSEKGYFVDVCKTYHSDRASYKGCQSELDKQLSQMQP